MREFAFTIKRGTILKSWRISERHASLSFSVTLEYPHHVLAHTHYRYTDKMHVYICICYAEMCGICTDVHTRYAYPVKGIHMIYVCTYIYAYVLVVLIICVRKHAARSRQLYVHLKKKKKNRSSYDRNSDLRYACRVFKSQQKCAQHAPQTIRVYVTNQCAISIARPFLETRASVL